MKMRVVLQGPIWMRYPLEMIVISRNVFLKKTWMNETCHTDDIYVVHQDNIEIYFPYVKVKLMNDV